MIGECNKVTQSVTTCTSYQHHICHSILTTALDTSTHQQYHVTENLNLSMRLKSQQIVNTTSTGLPIYSLPHFLLQINSPLT